MSRALSRSTSLQECAIQLGISISSLVRKKRSINSKSCYIFLWLT
ncbi:hypothetical protein [Peribacillus butanolivorans]